MTIDAMGTQVAIAAKIVSHGADFLLPLKGNQPTLEADVADYLRTAPKAGLVTETTVEKGHGRIETRVVTASGEVDWILADRSYPGQPASRGSNPSSRSRRATNTPTDRPSRRVTSSRRLSPTSSASPGAPGGIEVASQGTPPAKRDGVAGGGVESMHWLLGVAFKDDLSCYRTGHGAKNMAVIRRLVLNLVRANPQKKQR